MNGLEFATPWLLVGLLAAGIPFLLHLLSSVRAQEVYFPTLRFLKLSMEKTARRRRIHHWLLLALRAALLALLALAVAQPITRLSKGYQGSSAQAAVIILDNSYSMAARSGAAARLDQAKGQALSLLEGPDRPGLCAVLTTTGDFASPGLVSERSSLVTALRDAKIGYGQAPLAQRVQQAIGMLQKEDSVPQRSIYIFSDMQQESFREMLGAEALAAAKDMHLFVIDCAGAKAAANVGISDLQIEGEAIVDQPLAFVATLLNSSPEARKVEVALQVDGKQGSAPQTVTLAPAGAAGDRTTVRFEHVFRAPGSAAGEVAIMTGDDLPADNVRRFSLQVARRVKALIVRGAVADDDHLMLDPARALRLALDPFGEPDKLWSIAPQTIEARDFTAANLRDTDIAFFCEAPSFTVEQAQAIADYAAAGGTCVFFLGPDVLSENYNNLFVDGIKAKTAGALLPAVIGRPVGEVGPAADAKRLDAVDTAGPIFKGLYEDSRSYMKILAQRYFQLKLEPGASVLMRLEGSAPLLCAKPYDRGMVYLCAVPASPRWSNLPRPGLFLPMVVRMSLQAAGQGATGQSYLPGALVRLAPGMPADEAASPPQELSLTVDREGSTKTVTLKAKWDQRLGFVATDGDTAEPGVYRWRAGSGELALKHPSGAFAINPVGAECDLARMSPQQLADALHARKLERIYIAGDLQAAQQLAAAAASGRNWWDLLLAVVIVMLVTEAIVANRRKLVADALPTYLNPKTA